ncbi:hypothetical protein [Actinomadura rupiterrae]|uniref:hypothetical protein n=1 Tax=Actinomadura rupiterrae TaxID=559627 RepID=UPI0020A4B15E|nr:hypothetical protein [Actinomadura rupiterrae]MCP2341046.1 hypothetical protein [Actinomadura rupiterrae]
MLTRRRTLLGALTMSAATAAATLLSAGPAAAEYKGYGGIIELCPRGDFCVSDDYNGYSGNVWGWYGSDRDWWLNDGGASGPNNRDNSWYNHGNADYYDHVIVYKYGNGGSGAPSTPTICLPRDDFVNGLNEPGAAHQGSAHIWTHTC